MSQAVCLFAVPASFAERADCEDVSGGALFQHPLREPLRGIARSRSRPLCGDVSSGEALVSAPVKGAAEGYCTVPFAAVVWGCLK
eukprot:7524089-Pyramimonas_sp.AAC.1